MVALDSPFTQLELIRELQIQIRMCPELNRNNSFIDIRAIMSHKSIVKYPGGMDEMGWKSTSQLSHPANIQNVPA